MSLENLLNVVEVMTRLNDNFDTCLLGSLFYFLVPASRIAIDVLLEHAMGNLPSLEEFRQEVCGITADDEKLREWIDLGDAVRDILH